MSASGGGTSDSVATIAGVIAEAVREGLQRTLSSRSPGPSQNASPSALQSGGLLSHDNSSLYQRVSAVGSAAGASSYNPGTPRSDSLPGSGSQSCKKRFAAPTMFKGKRSRRNEPQPKPVTYVRDVFCLPSECQGPNGTVVIPRGCRRSALANDEIGLLGKIAFDSDWSDERMREEISAVFSKSFGINEEDLARGKVFKFDYLQRTGAGSRTLCIPSVSQTFQWNGR